MLLSRIALAASAALLAVAAHAQNSDEPGLSDLGETLEQLSDEAPAETEPPAEPDAEPQEAEPPGEEPAGAEAEAEAEAEPGPEPEQPVEAEAAPPAAPAGPAPPLTRAEIATLAETIERGKLLIAIARAGIIATQDMLTRISDPEGAGIDGWIAEPEGNGMGVTFYSAAGDGPREVYRTSVNGGRVVGREIHLGADGPALNPIQARMAAARAATASLDHSACSGQTFNVLVVPPTSLEAPIHVYQLTPPSQAGLFPLGGHFRSTIAADGSVADTRKFTNSCVDIEAPAAAGDRPAPPIGVTHLLDPMPTEVHLFLSQLIGRPLLVATGEPQRIWLVTPERIAEVRP